MQFYTHIETRNSNGHMDRVSLLMDRDEFLANGWGWLADRVVAAVNEYGLTGEIAVWGEEC